MLGRVLRGLTMSGVSQEITYLKVEHDGEQSLLVAPVGVALRDALLANGISPYTSVTKRLNCGGRGLCATCGVRFVDDTFDTGDRNEGDDADDANDGCGASTVPAPDHWHDSLAARFGYPRLSCQIDVEGDMHIEIPEKIVWGSRRPGGHGDNESGEGIVR